MGIYGYIFPTSS